MDKTAKHFVNTISMATYNFLSLNSSFSNFQINPEKGPCF
jgi:hypothetical protein